MAFAGVRARVRIRARARERARARARSMQFSMQNLSRKKTASKVIEKAGHAYLEMQSRQRPEAPKGTENK